MISKWLRDSFIKKKKKLETNKIKILNMRDHFDNLSQKYLACFLNFDLRTTKLEGFFLLVPHFLFLIRNNLNYKIDIIGELIIKRSPN